MSAFAPGDLGLAGRGDLEALRRLRAQWFDLATGDLVHPLLPTAEALPQAELLAEITASASLEAVDQVALLVVYHIRMEALARDIRYTQNLAKQAVADNNIDDLSFWTRSEVEVGGRLEHYQAKVRSLTQNILASDDVAGAAMIFKALSIQADGGDERAVPTLQVLMSSVPSERAQAILTHVREMEKATVQ